MRPTRRVLVCVAVVAMAATACAGDEAADDLPDVVASPLESPEPPTDPSPAESPGDDEGSAMPDATASPTELAGEPFDGPPLNGAPATLDVIGVAADDVLNVRAGPGVDAEIVATLPPLTTDVRATGAARLLPGSIWLELEVDGTTGWANSSYLAFLGGTDDITARLLDQLDERPSAPTLEELAREVAALVASTDPPSEVVISDGPSVGDLGEVTVDVVGLGDDAGRGFRLVVFATQDDDGFTLRTVESTDLCARGTTGDGVCV